MPSPRETEKMKMNNTTQHNSTTFYLQMWADEERQEEQKFLEEQHNPEILTEQARKDLAEVGTATGMDNIINSTTGLRVIVKRGRNDI